MSRLATPASQGNVTFAGILSLGGDLRVRRGWGFCVAGSAGAPKTRVTSQPRVERQPQPPRNSRVYSADAGAIMAAFTEQDFRALDKWLRRQ
jgi:hypothetical protein